MSHIQWLRSIISICFGMGHSLCSEPGSILLMPLGLSALLLSSLRTPIKVMQSLVAAVLLVDHSSVAQVSETSRVVSHICRMS